MQGNEVVVLVPYFGRLPNYFDLWLTSAARNSAIDWILLTDNPIEPPPSGNVRIIGTTFAQVQSGFQDVFDFPLGLHHPYKLCDFKPAYGLIFHDLVEGYRFWGHADLDVVWGMS